MRVGTRPLGALSRAVLALLGTLGVAGGCVSPPSAEALVATGFRSPRQAVESFQTFVRAELPAREYRCFSMDFRARNGLSALSYGEARDELFRTQPWLKLIATAEIVDEGSEGEGRHWVELSKAGRTVRVKLVREDFFEIQDAHGLLTDGDADFERLALLGSDGRRLRLSLPLEDPLEGLEGVSEVLVARHWKIDDLDLRGDEEAAEPPATP